MVTVRLASAVLGLAAISLLLPGTPTYDPFAWIVWGREVLHGDLVTSVGPSWKPLPVAFTMVFALFGSAAPWLWLLVARAGAIAALITAYKLVRRLDGGGVIGGVAAVAALALAPWWLFNAGLGNSEGLMAFFVLAAIERGLAAEHRTAFWLACGAALLRPESWPFLALYGLWLMYRRELRPIVVVGTGALVLACWLLPEWWGSGDLFRAANRARTDIDVNAPTNADSPVLAVFGDAFGMLTVPVEIGLVAAVLVTARSRDRVLATLLGASVVWLALVGAMTSNGFSGNQRYLIVPVALLIVIAGVGIGRLLDRYGSHRAIAAAAIGLIFAAPSISQLQITWDRLDYQEAMTRALPGLVEKAGGPAGVRSCGAVSTGRYLVPQLAWYTELHLRDVSQITREPGTVFVVHTTATSRWGPPGGAITPKPLARDLAWRVYQRCGAAQ